MTIRNLRTGTLASKRNLNPRTVWTRNPSWLTLPDVAGLQKFAGLHAIFENGPNFVSLNSKGNYTVNWGDGTSENVSSGVQAERNIAYSDASATSDIGIADAIACTFTDAGDTVGLTGHGWKNGQKIAFSSITATTGISTYTSYFIVNKTTDTFQVSTTVNGSPITLTTNGSGEVYIPKYRQVIITVVPNGGNLTELYLHTKHSTVAALTDYSSGWLDIAISAQYLTLLTLGTLENGLIYTDVYHNLLEQFNLVASNLRQLNTLFSGCSKLSNIKNLCFNTDAAVSSACTFTDSTNTVNQVAHGFNVGDTVIFTSVTSTTGISTNTSYYVSNVTADTYKINTNPSSGTVNFVNDGSGVSLRGTSFKYTFYKCTSLYNFPIFDTSNGIEFQYAFQYCYNLVSAPYMDLKSAYNVGGMFQYCYALKEVPSYNLSSCLYFRNMFQYCSNLAIAPNLNTSAGIDFQSMFYGCSALKTIPKYDTALATTLTFMFWGCSSLENIPLIDTHLVTDFGSMFSGCYSLLEIPLLNTSSGTNLSNMFSSCWSIKSIPKLNTSAGTNFSSMFTNCFSLQDISHLDTSSGTNFANMFQSCYAISDVPNLNFSQGTNCGNVFTNCFSLKSARMEGTVVDIAYSNDLLSAGALNDIYTGLGTVTGKTITVSGNWGTASDDPTIATAKGWTVTG